MRHFPASCAKHAPNERRRSPFLFPPLFFNGFYPAILALFMCSKRQVSVENSNRGYFQVIFRLVIGAGGSLAGSAGIRSKRNVIPNTLPIFVVKWKWKPRMVANFQQAPTATASP